MPASGIADKLNHQLFEIEGRKPRDNRGSMSNRQGMDMDDDACYLAHHVDGRIVRVPKLMPRDVLSRCRCAGAQAWGTSTGYPAGALAVH